MPAEKRNSVFQRTPIGILTTVTSPFQHNSHPSSATKRWLHREVEAFQHPHRSGNGHSKVNRAQARRRVQHPHSTVNIGIAVASASIRAGICGPKRPTNRGPGDHIKRLEKHTGGMLRMKPENILDLEKYRRAREIGPVHAPKVGNPYSFLANHPHRHGTSSSSEPHLYVNHLQRTIVVDTAKDYYPCINPALEASWLQDEEDSDYPNK
ncbi:hypothetical protein Nepgr_006733 [Nepenthes gracilis]|uniref:Uncharacterized protein n=1 Tax=Nepenthes gracilis TaxID=150966 RepID=A0AAD3S5K1_NEPGR|nr:hypothetical protein Nepgr_006733 [Nepenthes gracilis]